MVRPGVSNWRPAMATLDVPRRPARLPRRGRCAPAAEPGAQHRHRDVLRAARAGDRGRRHEAEVDFPRWWLVVTDEAGEVVGAAMRTAPFAPYPLYLLAMPDEAAVALARAAARARRGRSAASTAPAGDAGCAPRRRPGWPEAPRRSRSTCGCSSSRPSCLRGRPRGRCDSRRRRTASSPRVVRRVHAGRRRAGRPRAGQCARSVETMDGMLRRIELGRIWFWEDGSGERVHLTGANPPSYGAARVGPVYTPVQHRGRGYASRAVAEVSRLILDGGARPCLFTDQANPPPTASTRRSATVRWSTWRTCSSTPDAGGAA